MMLKSVGPLAEPVRTLDSQSLEGCVLAPRKKEITNSDQPQRPGKRYSIEFHRRIGISFDERSALLLDTPFLSTFKWLYRKLGPGNYYLQRLMELYLNKALKSVKLSNKNRMICFRVISKVTKVTVYLEVKSLG